MTGRSTQAARFLLGVGLAAGDADARGNTPLHAAVQLGHAEMIELLFSFGASADARNDAGETPLDMVAVEYAAIPSLHFKAAAPTPPFDIPDPPLDPELCCAFPLHPAARVEPLCSSTADARVRAEVAKDRASAEERRVARGLMESDWLFEQLE